MRPTKATATHLFKDIKTDPETKETLKRHLLRRELYRRPSDETKSPKETEMPL